MILGGRWDVVSVILGREGRWVVYKSEVWVMVSGCLMNVD